MKIFTSLVLSLLFCFSLCAETRTAKQAKQWNKKQKAVPLVKYDCKDNKYCQYSKDDWKDVGSSHPKNLQFQIMKKMRDLQQVEGSPVKGYGVGK